MQQNTDYDYEEGMYDKLSDYFHARNYTREKEIFEFVIKNVEENYDLKIAFFRYMYRKYRYEVDIAELRSLIIMDKVLYSLLIDALLLASDAESESLMQKVTQKDDYDYF